MKELLLAIIVFGLVGCAAKESKVDESAACHSAVSAVGGADHKHCQTCDHCKGKTSDECKACGACDQSKDHGANCSCKDCAAKHAVGCKCEECKSGKHKCDAKDGKACSHPAKKKK